MRARRAEDEGAFFADAAGAEEEHHDEGVRESDFRAVDGAVARGFHDREEVVVGRVHYYALDGCLGGLEDRRLGG